MANACYMRWYLDIISPADLILRFPIVVKVNYKTWPETNLSFPENKVLTNGDAVAGNNVSISKKVNKRG